MGQDNEGIAAAVEGLAAQFNTTMAATRGNNQFVANSVAQSLRNAVGSQADELEDIGINSDSSGRITVDQERLAAALDEDSEGVTAALTGREGLVTNIGNAAERLFTQPISNFTMSQPALERQNQIRQYQLALIQAQVQSGGSLLSGPNFVVNNIT